MSSDTDTASPPFVVQAPFDDPAIADIVLRSSDSVDFYVFKSVLMVASPIFRDMVTISMPPSPAAANVGGDTTKDGLPIIPMYESSAPVLDTLMRILYPVVSPRLDDLGIALGVFSAAKKYEMTYASDIAEEGLIRLAKSGSAALPIQLYILASGQGLTRLARCAAFESLKYPLDTSLFLPAASASLDQLRRLFIYRQQVLERTCLLITQRTIKADSDFLHPEFCSKIKALNICDINCAKGLTENSVIWPSWRAIILSEIYKAPLADNVIDKKVLLELVGRTRCGHCPGRLTLQAPLIVDAFKEELARLASEVRC